MSRRSNPGLVVLLAVLAACSSVAGTESTDASNADTSTTQSTLVTTTQSIPAEVLQAANDCVGIRLVGEALVLLVTDVDEKIAMAEAVSTSEDVREMGIAMAESSTVLQVEAERMGEISGFEGREDLTEVASWVETGQRQTAENYNIVVNALLDNDAVAMSAAVADFDRIWPAIVDTMNAFTPLLKECPGTERDIVRALESAGPPEP